MEGWGVFKCRVLLFKGCGERKVLKNILTSIRRVNPVNINEINKVKIERYLMSQYNILKKKKFKYRTRQIKFKQNFKIMVYLHPNIH